MSDDSSLKSHTLTGGFQTDTTECTATPASLSGANLHYDHSQHIQLLHKDPGVDDYLSAEFKR